MKKLQTLTVLLSVMLTFTAFANEGDQLTQWQNTLQTKSETMANQAVIASSYQQQVAHLNNYQSVLSTLNDTALTGLNTGSRSNSSQTSKAATGVMVFVSLGMPVETLRQIFTQAHELGIPVIVRGALDNNFQESAKVLFTVLHPQNQPVIDGGLTIDPLWFREFGITQVPAVVAVAPGGSCAGVDIASDKNCVPSFDVVYGNVSIPAALKTIAEQGEAAPEVARQFLSKLGGKANAY